MTMTEICGRSTTEPTPNVVSIWLGRNSPTRGFSRPLLMGRLLLSGHVHEVGLVVQVVVVQDQERGRLDLPERVQAGVLVPRLDARLVQQADGLAVLLALVAEPTTPGEPQGSLLPVIHLLPEFRLAFGGALVLPQEPRPPHDPVDGLLHERVGRVG